jgi:hypothetical protein
MRIVPFGSKGPDTEGISFGKYFASLERLFLALLGFSRIHIYLLSELGKLPKGRLTRGLISHDLWSFFQL